MPVQAEATKVFWYPMAKYGVNLHRSLVDLSSQECVTSQNLVWRNGMVKRPGSSKFHANEVTTGKRIGGMGKFYYSGGSQLLVASGVNIARFNSGWTNITTSQTDGAETFFTTWLDKSYIANQSDAPKSWDGTAFATVSAAPADTVMLLPYQDRLLSLQPGGVLRWSDSFSVATWESEANCGVKPDSRAYGMTLHSSNNVDYGYQSKVLIAGDNGMYLFSGTDLRVPATTGDYQIHKVFDIGCNAPRTMVWTPAGTIWLGIDRQVYLLPFETSTPVPIGNNIRSTRTGESGIENIPAAYISKACAVYNDGFYKLSVTPEGQTTNTDQWWLDVTRLFQSEDKERGPWYGPMKGQTISCFASLTGGGDAGDLIGGEDVAATGSYVYNLNKDSDYGDVGTAIQIYYQTFYNPMESPHLAKDVHRIEAELLDVLGTVSFGMHDITGALTNTGSFALSGSAVYWDDQDWNDFYWSSSAPTRAKVDISPAAHARRVSMTIDHSSNDDTFELYALGVEGIEQSLVFE